MSVSGLSTQSLTLQVTREDSAPCEVKLTVEVGQDAVEQAYEKALRRVAQHVEVPGFRKGKAPINLVRPLVSENRLTEIVRDDLIPQAYEQAVKQECISPFASPDLSLKQLERGNAMVMEAVVPLTPKVELGDVIGLQLEQTVHEPTPEAIERQIGAWREERAQFDETPEKPAEIGDLLRVNMLVCEGSRQENADPELVILEIGRNHPDLDRQLIGLGKGDRKIIVITYPEGEEGGRLAGKTVTYSLEALAVGRKQLPELTDDYLRDAGIDGGPEGFRKQIESEMRRWLDEMAQSELRGLAVGKAVEASTVHFPLIMVQREVYQNLLAIKKEAEKNQMGLRQFFEAAGKDIAEYERQTAQEAARKIAVGLVLGEIANKYDIAVSEEDLRAECNSIGEREKLPGDVIFERLRGTRALEGLEDQILYKKITDFLIAGANVKRTLKPLSEAVKEGEGGTAQ